MDCLTNESSLLYRFVSDDTAMQRFMLAYGLHVDNLDCAGQEQSLCYHILHGLCADIPTDNNLKRNVCDNILGTCLSARQLELLMMFIDKLAVKMHLKSFRQLCTSIDIPEYTFLP
jgi:hypothetical protein